MHLLTHSCTNIVHTCTLLISIKVMQVRKKDDGKIYAMKVLRKDTIVARKQVAHTKAEKNVSLVWLASLYPHVTISHYFYAQMTYKDIDENTTPLHCELELRIPNKGQIVYDPRLYQRRRAVFPFKERGAFRREPRKTVRRRDCLRARALTQPRYPYMRVVHGSVISGPLYRVRGRARSLCNL